MAEGYKPTDGMKSAARRALQWKKEGKRGGTRVGLTRANQIVNGESLSESTVMRMYSFFSRHEVDKKATGFNSGEEGFPSPGRVAWDLWGGDAGFSWSRQKAESIKNKRTNKMSSIWDGAFLGALGKSQVEEASPELDEVDEPLEPEVEETPKAVETAPVESETPAPAVEEPKADEPVAEVKAEVAPATEASEPVVEESAPAEPAAEAPAEEDKPTSQVQK